MDERRERWQVGCVLWWGHRIGKTGGFCVDPDVYQKYPGLLPTYTYAVVSDSSVMVIADVKVSCNHFSSIFPLFEYLVVSIPTHSRHFLHFYKNPMHSILIMLLVPWIYDYLPSDPTRS